MRWLLDQGRWERAVLALIAAAVAYQVFCEPIVGTADTRDYWRVMKQIGVQYRGGIEPPVGENIQRDFDVVPREPIAYLTSAALLGRIAVFANSVVSKDGLFDLRMMGLVNSAAYLAALAVFLATLRRRPHWMRVAMGLAAVVVFTDVRLVAYFNSFFSESAQLIFLVATLGFALLAIDEARPLRQRRWSYAGFFGSAILFAVAKPQDLVFCFPLAVIAFRSYPSAGPRRGAAALAAAMFLGLFAWGMLSDANATTNWVNRRVAVLEEILPNSKTPDADLQELGDGDVAKATFASIAMFYAHHPIRWWKMCKRQGRKMFTHWSLGNFPAPLKGESHALEGFNLWKDRHYPRSLWFWIAAIASYGAVLGARWRRGGREDRSLALFHAMWLVGCV
ncbi:MAG TPA: hypothetical protein VK607_22030, partial [Kofleriaceae bacterium]|nr:hypothetical protein [Kofleriaceae bacterium]